MIDFLKTYGPTILVFILSYYRDRAIDSKNKERIAELETKLLQNGIDVNKENAGLSSDAIISKYITGPKP